MEFFSEYLIPIFLGIGLSAACGLRVFLPVFALSLVSYFGNFTLSENFHWLATLPAVIAFGAATVLEIIAYYIPWLDHLLDSVTIPSSIAGGTMLLASVNPELEPLIKWTLALIAGGGTAGIISVGTAMTRLKSTAMSGGATNFIIATIENAGSLFLTIVAFLIPVIAVIIVAGFLYFCVLLIRKVKRTVAGS
ncbi:MAG: DUF4126 domain-containing protein [Chitinophagales bacterium]|nr:DUF4126 domain-containing protein [Chitinophagales bacterium]